MAANFRPVALWNKLWPESKEELTRERIAKAEEERKAKVNAEMEAKYRNKADIEARYAEMMRTGGFNFTKVGSLANGAANEARPLSQASHTPRDSGIDIDIDDLDTPIEDKQIDPFTSQQPSEEHKRSLSYGSQLAPPADDTTSRSGSEVPETTSKPHKGVKSRLQHFKKASLTNIKVDLKRVKSDFNLAHNRESSSSVSPVKTNGFTLTKSISKSDLRKQHKLSKRVSDLEAKLEQARKELGDAIGEASPMPTLTGKYERFTPIGSITVNKRPKFIPGNLPTLPSERILMAEQLGFEPYSEAGAEAGVQVEAHDTFRPRDPSHSRDTSHPHEQSHLHEPYQPQRGSSLFKLENGNIEDLDASAITVVHDTNIKGEAPTSIHFPSEPLEMDPNSFASDIVPEPSKPVDYADLDAKLKALEANTKKARQRTGSKKRKSGAAEDEKAFKPGEDSDDDAEWEQATPRKKRKAALGKRDSTPMGVAMPAIKPSVKNGPEEPIIEQESEQMEAMEQVGHVLEPVWEEDSQTIEEANGTLTSSFGDETVQGIEESMTMGASKETLGTMQSMTMGASKETLGTVQSQCTELKMEGGLQEHEKRFGRGDDFEWPEDVF